MAGFSPLLRDERWIVPHFEKMSYDNSELLRNYVHGYQATGSALFREVAEGIVKWVSEVASDTEHGGFYASQDADVGMEDDGDYSPGRLMKWKRSSPRRRTDNSLL